MRIIAKRSLRDFWKKHAKAKGPLEAWYREAKRALWKSPVDIRKEFSRADFVSNNRVVFDISGNRYRLIVAIRYDLGIVYIRFVGTHAEYDCIDASKI